MRQAIKSSREKGGVGKQVVWGENHHLADFFADAVTAVLAHEKPLEPLGGNIGFDIAGKKSVAGPLERVLVKIRSENLNAGKGFVLSGFLKKQDRERVGFFARGATDAPHADFVVGILTHKELGNNFLLELFEHFGIAKEAGDRDQQIVGKDLHFLGMLAEEFQIIGQQFHLVELHAALNSPQDGRSFVAAEVAARAGPKLGKYLLNLSRSFAVELVDVGHVGELWLDARVLQRDLGNLGERQNEIDHPRGDGALRHAIVFRLIGVLNDGEAAALLDFAHTERAIAPRAGEDHADRFAVVGLGERAKEMIDGSAFFAMLLELGQAEMSVN